MTASILPTSTDTDLVVLLDQQRQPIGTMPRDTVHGPDTPLHLAFSVYVFDIAGRLLMTRRALTKRTWPGVWTNSCCGHVRPDERPIDAVRRRTSEELGLDLGEIDVVLPDFAYRAISAEGVVENEVCPVFATTVDSDPTPIPDEVAEWRWVDWSGLRTAVERAPWLVSPWAAVQVPLMPAIP
jgi:isopentenyl-diphosphate delta-isomerase type 1